MLLTSAEEVEFREKTHQYFRFGREYLSQSSFVKIFEPKFDREGRSRMVAKARGVTQEQVLREWDKKRDDAAEYGTGIHAVI